MQNKTFKNFIKKILTEGKINSSAIPASIKKSGDFNTLINGGFLEHLISTTGGGSFYVKNVPALEKYFIDKFPDFNGGGLTAVNNVNSLRNTKAGKRESQSVILIRGQKSIVLNGIETDLAKFTGEYGTFSAMLNSLKTDKVCFVENLDTYFMAEQVIKDGYVFIHTYGGLGRAVIGKLDAQEILIFPDYDFKGLHNYLMVKSIFENCKLYIPDNYQTLFETKSRTIKTSQGREQQPSKQVLDSVDEIVVKIRGEIFRHKKFLEQQALFK